MKRILVYLTVFLAAAMLPVAASAQSLTWHADTLIRYTTYDAGSPSVAISGDNAVAVWKHSTSGHDQIYASYSTDKGKTWSSPVDVDYSTLNAAEPKVAIDGSNVVVVFRQYDGDEYRIYANYSTDGGQTWGGAQLIENNGATSSGAASAKDKPADIGPRNAEEPQVVISGSNVVAIWKQYDGSKDRIYANHSTNGGQTWGTVITLDQRLSAAKYPRLAMSGSNVVAVWTQNGGGFDNVCSRYSSDAGVTWSLLDVRVDNVNQNSYDPRIAISGSNVVMVWTAYPAGLGRIYSNRAAFSGGVLTWTPTNTQLIENNDTIDQDTPQVAISGSNVVAVWNGYPGSTYRVYTVYSTNAGASWGASQLLQTADVDTGNPQVSVSGRNVVAIWQQDEGVNRIYARHSFDGGSSWKDPALIEDNTGKNAYSPALAISGSAVVAVWIQLSDGASSAGIGIMGGGDYAAVYSNYANFSSMTILVADDGKCFIATAAFGSPLAGQVEILRQFRDKYLLTNVLGRKFVVWYYKNGPAAAAFIADKPLVKLAIQAALYPLIGFSFVLVNGFMPFVLMGLLLAGVVFFRFRMKKVGIE